MAATPIFAKVVNEAPPELLTSLNRTTIENLSDIVKEKPAIDLWPRLREQIRKYKAECDKAAGKPEPPGKAGEACI